MKNEEKAYQIIKDFQNQNRDFDKFDAEDAAMEMAEWKDVQQKENMLKFMRWLEKRGFIKEDLCYDTEHQVETFVNQILPQL